MPDVYNILMKEKGEEPLSALIDAILTSYAEIVMKDEQNSNGVSKEVIEA